MKGEGNLVHAEIDLYEVLTRRVQAREPIYIDGPMTASVEAMIGNLSEDTGTALRVVQVIGLRHQPI